MRTIRTLTITRTTTEIGTLRVKHDAEWDEWRVTLTTEKGVIATYHTDNEQDALGTAVCMAREFESRRN